MLRGFRMKNQNRRVFLQTSAAVLGAVVVAPDSSPALPSAVSGAVHAPTIASDAGKRPLRLGLIIAIGHDPQSAIAKVRDLGLPTAQIYVEDFHPGLDGQLRRALKMYD